MRRRFWFCRWWLQPSVNWYFGGTTFRGRVVESYYRRIYWHDTSERAVQGVNDLLVDRSVMLYRNCRLCLLGFMVLFVFEFFGSDLLPVNPMEWPSVALREIVVSQNIEGIATPILSLSSFVQLIDSSFWILSNALGLIPWFFRKGP